MVNRAIGCEDTDLKGRFAQYLSLADSAMVYVGRVRLFIAQD